MSRSKANRWVAAYADAVREQRERQAAERQPLPVRLRAELDADEPPMADQWAGLSDADYRRRLIAERLITPRTNEE